MSSHVRSFLATLTLAGVLTHVPACIAFARNPSSRSEGAGSGTSRLEVGRGERLLVIAPHPDDETIGAGGLMQRVLERGGSVTVVLVTAGDGFVDAVTREHRNPLPRHYLSYGERRIREAKAAMRAIGSGAIDLRMLGFPDGGLDELLTEHWQQSRPFRSATTTATDPPYDSEAVSPRAPYAGSVLLRELTSIMRAQKPTLVALPDPLDRHADHGVTGVFALLSIAELRRASGASGRPMPRLVSYLVHWPAWPPGWEERPASAHGSSSTLVLPQDLAQGRVQALRLDLDTAEIERKRHAMARYVSQQAVSAPYLAAFVGPTEPFRRLGDDDVRAALSRAPNVAETRALRSALAARSG